MQRFIKSALTEGARCSDFDLDRAINAAIDDNRLTGEVAGLQRPPERNVQPWRGHCPIPRPATDQRLRRWRSCP
jgi:hypothetical protein